MMEQKTGNLKNLDSELENLPLGKVLEIKYLTKYKADKLFDSYSKMYVVRGPLQDSQGTKYSLFFELNPYTIGRK